MNNLSTLRLIAVNLKAGRIELAVKTAVLGNLEAGYTGKMRGFFIGNAESDFMKAGGTLQQFAGGLGAMTKKGEYQASDDAEYKGHYGYFVWKEATE